MCDFCSYNALVFHDMYDVVTYSSRKSLLRLIEEYSKVILKTTLWFKEATYTNLKGKKLFLEQITRLMSATELFRVQPDLGHVTKSNANPTQNFIISKQD